MLADGLSATDELIGKVKSSALSEQAKYDVLHELDAKRTQFNDALALSLSVSLDANITSDQTKAIPDQTRGFGRIDQPTFPMAIPGQKFRVLVHVADNGNTPVNLDSSIVELNGSAIPADSNAGRTSGQIDGGGMLNTLFTVQIPENSEYTRPYFNRPSIDQSYYDVRKPEYRNLPLAPYPLQAKVSLSYHGAHFEMSEAVQTVQREVGAGTVNEPLPIGPAISLTMLNSAGVLPLDKTSIPLSVKVHNNVNGPAQGTVHLDLPTGWKSAPANQPFAFAQDGQEQIATFNVTPAAVQEKAYQIAAVATYANHEYKEGFIQIGYPGLRPYFEYSQAKYQLNGANVKVSSTRQIGYIEGSGDDIPASLENLGVHVQFLTRDDLATGDLKKYDEILVGVRAYAVREDLRTFNGRLMDYVKNGGALVVQYQTPEFDHNYGPYPYSMTSNPEEVTDEHSVVTILDPNNPAFKWPNVITQKDFDGWIEERGSKS